MWLSAGLGLPISLLGLAAQVPLEPPKPTPTMVASYGVKDFEFKQGENIFSPVDLVKLARPGTGAANPAGDLFIVPVSKYSLDEKKCVHQRPLEVFALTCRSQEPQIHLYRPHRVVHPASRSPARQRRRSVLARHAHHRARRRRRRRQGQSKGTLCLVREGRN